MTNEPDAIQIAGTGPNTVRSATVPDDAPPAAPRVPRTAPAKPRSTKPRRNHPRGSAENDRIYTAQDAMPDYAKRLPPKLPPEEPTTYTFDRQIVQNPDGTYRSIPFITSSDDHRIELRPDYIAIRRGPHIHTCYLAPGDVKAKNHITSAITSEPFATLLDNLRDMGTVSHRTAYASSARTSSVPTATTSVESFPELQDMLQKLGVSRTHITGWTTGVGFTKPMVFKSTADHNVSCGFF